MMAVKRAARQLINAAAPTILAACALTPIHHICGGRGSGVHSDYYGAD